MTVTVEEKYDSRESGRGRNNFLVRNYVIQGTDSDATARSNLAATAPTTVDGYIRQSYRVEPVGDPTQSETWIGEARYGVASFSTPESGDSVFNFETAGGQLQITQSLDTVASYPTGEAPDFEGAIGYDGERVQGTSIVHPIYNWGETHWFEAGDVTITYRSNLFNQTGTVNNAIFKGMDPGECLFLGASGTRRGTGSNDDWEISFRFASQPNQSGLTIGSITGITKKGWDFLWVRYADEVVTVDTNEFLIQRPKNVYVEQIYKTSNFADLGIGTT